MIGYICAMAKIKNIDTLSVDCSILCCNFVNTVSSWKERDSHEYLESYDSFLAWCRKLRAAPPSLLQPLAETAQEHGARTDRALGKIKEIRSLLQRFISAIAHDHEALVLELLPKIDQLFREASAKEQLEYREGNFSMDRNLDPKDLLAPLWPVVHSLKGLILENALARIKECPSCGWVFLDRTKNGRRIWCNPQVCGTYDKMRRYNERKKGNLPL